jgi:hypothetical protein
MSLPTSLAELAEFVDFNKQSLFGMWNREQARLPSRGRSTDRTTVSAAAIAFNPTFWK